VGGHLTALRRTRVGTVGIDEAQTLDEAAQRLVVLSPDQIVRRFFATVTVTDVQASYVRNGRRLIGVSLPEARTGLFTEADHFLALYRQEGLDAVAEAVFG